MVSGSGRELAGYLQTTIELDRFKLLLRMFAVDFVKRNTPTRKKLLHAEGTFATIAAGHEFSAERYQHSGPRPNIHLFRFVHFSFLPIRARRAYRAGAKRHSA